MRKISTFLLILLFVIPFANGQIQPGIFKATYFDKTPPLREMKLIPPAPRDQGWKEGIIRNESPEREQVNDNPLPNGADPVWQDHFGSLGLRETMLNFEGIPNRNSVYPPDTDGDVGPDHYFQMINLSFQIFDKSGNSLYGPADNRTLWDGFIGPWSSTNDGDPILLYDEQADRWVATQFAIDTPDDTYWELIAISATGDPLGAWYRYAFQFPVFNDYPKFGVWPDAYYCSFNMFGSYRRVAAAAFERDAMLAGDTNARMILFDLPENSQPWSMLPADYDGPLPPGGTPNYFAYAMDDAFGPDDALYIWEFNSNWEDPGESTFEEIAVIPVEPFDSKICDAYRYRCIPQPDDAPLLETLSDRLMYRLQYRNFGDYQVMVTNHTVDVDGFGHAGIRWYELRDNNDGNGWHIYQQGTYAPDEDHRWMGSIAMNGNGDIALGFSVSSVNKYPSIHYTGRTADSPPGEMTFFEEEVIAGSGVQTGTASRWGDYSMMSVDPSDDSTFWYTTEYVEQSGSVRWQTRIAAFQLIEDLIPPGRVSDLQAESVTTNALLLHWTATGNDGDVGTAFLYDIRYSEQPIDESNFEQALPVDDPPKPQESGSPESFIVKNLEYSTTWYFAMKVRDKQFNFSGMSNVSHATTPGPPQLFVQEDTVLQKIFAGSAGTRPWSVQNLGASDIYYQIAKDTLNGAGQGDILGSYENAVNANTGMAWVGGFIYMTDMQASLLLKYDTASQQILESSPVHDTPFGIIWDNNNLWIGSKTGEVYAYNLDGTATGDSFSCPFTGFTALSWDGENFLVNFIMASDPVIYKVDQNGTVLERYYTDMDNMNIWQSVWVPEHHSGHFWFTNNRGIIAQMKLQEGMAVLVDQFDAPSSAAYALTHDHYDLWYGQTDGTIYRIDDGVEEVNWLSISPENATLHAGATLDIDLTFNTEKLEPVVYHANMRMSSNDPEQPEYKIPVKLMITTIDIGPDTSFCGHLSLLLDAGDGFEQYTWSDESTAQTMLVDSSGYGFGPAVFWVDVSDIGRVTERDSVLITFNDCTAIHEFDNGAVISVHPNPTSGIVEVHLEGVKDIITLKVVDFNGRVLFNEKIYTDHTASRKIQLDLSGEPNGIYIIRIASQGISLTQKLLKR